MFAGHLRRDAERERGCRERAALGGFDEHSHAGEPIHAHSPLLLSTLVELCAFITLEF
jgi:hypothetical protein